MNPLQSRLVHFVIAVLFAAACLLPGMPADAADPRLQRAQERRTQVEQRLHVLLSRLDKVEAQTAEVEGRLADLRAQEQAHAQTAQAATGLVALRLRESYKRGSEPALALFDGTTVNEAAEQARLLGLLAMRSRVQFEHAAAAKVRTTVVAAEVDKTAHELQARREELRVARAAVQRALASAREHERDVHATIAAEQAARERAARAAAAREARERTLRERAARSRAAAVPAQAKPAAAAAATVVGGIACPVGAPRTYSDTYGAPRSGGRRHKGTDILAPRGTPIYAYENGTIARMNNSRVGGISIYLRGNSGTLYYYTHLQGYAGGVGPGSGVRAGQLIAYNGDTGNARGIPHLHFEVMPGGGGNVNPYPYVRRACG